MDTERALELYDQPLSALAACADRVRRENRPGEIGLCSIINARSGSCSEDCRFCAQSAHNPADAETYELRDVDSIVEAAHRAEEAGSRHFGIVTSGRGQGENEIERIAGAISRITSETDLQVCASLGCLEEPAFGTLREAGLSRYNHNIETSRRFFAEIVTTHSFEDRLRTVRLAAGAGLSVCCGGIIGMGETREDRVSMGLTLRELPVDSVPINILMPVPRTPLANTEPLSPVEILKTVAIFRLMMPERTIKVAGGRETGLGDFQGMAFTSGANGMIVGNYLTQKGRSLEDDRRLVEELEEAWGEEL
jgi:biotin synthase